MINFFVDAFDKENKNKIIFNTLESENKRTIKFFACCTGYERPLEDVYYVKVINIFESCQVLLIFLIFRLVVLVLYIFPFK